VPIIRTSQPIAPASFWGVIAVPQPV
jgi:hypothetical protein